MYTIKEICCGASKLLRSVLNRMREYQLRFNKKKEGYWYVDFPHWPFSHDNLAMVSGTDKMLELLSDGDTLWICPVTLFVLGRYPNFIYLGKI